MIERVWTALRRRPLFGIAISVAIHVALVLALFWVPSGQVRPQKRGDALIVELPNLDEPSGRGTPGPVAGAAPVPAAPEAARQPPAPPARPTPPATPRTPVAARPAPAAPQPKPTAVARAPQPPPRAAEGDMPAPKAAPQTAAATPELQPTTPSRPEAVQPSAPAPPPGAVAMTPPDIRSALRRGGGGGGSGAGGAGGVGTGRGGVEGEPIALDSKDPDFNDYLERVRALVKKHWSYPCVKNSETRECEYKSGQLVIDFGILRNGQLAFVELDRSTGHPIMDDYAANAIKLASPFPPIPPVLMQNRQGTGIPIRARFNYVVETGLTNVLR